MDDQETQDRELIIRAINILRRRHWAVLGIKEGRLIEDDGEGGTLWRESYTYLFGPYETITEEAVDFYSAQDYAYMVQCAGLLQFQGDD